jgi:hypothetical protein
MLLIAYALRCAEIDDPAVRTAKLRRRGAIESFAPAIQPQHIFYDAVKVAILTAHDERALVATESKAEKKLRLSATGLSSVQENVG